MQYQEGVNIQPWDIIAEYDLDFWEGGQITH